jgi:hypothetical protein
MESAVHDVEGNGVGHQIPLVVHGMGTVLRDDEGQFVVLIQREVDPGAVEPVGVGAQSAKLGRPADQTAVVPGPSVEAKSLRSMVTEPAAHI